MESRSTRKVEYNFVLSGYVECCSIGIALIKLDFSGYAEYQPIREAKFKLGSGGYAECQSTGRD